MKDCPFCTIPTKRIISQNDLAYAIRDGFPVGKFHTLIIPKRHAEDFFALTEAELLACNRLLLEIQQVIKKQDAAIGGFNIGVNAEEVVGQTIFHCHIHLIPRREGDVENPRGAFAI